MVDVNANYENSDRNMDGITRAIQYQSQKQDDESNDNICYKRCNNQTEIYIGNLEDVR